MSASHYLLLVHHRDFMNGKQSVFINSNGSRQLWHIVIRQHQSCSEFHARSEYDFGFTDPREVITP